MSFREHKNRVFAAVLLAAILSWGAGFAVGTLRTVAVFRAALSD